MRTATVLMLAHLSVFLVACQNPAPTSRASGLSVGQAGLAFGDSNSLLVAVDIVSDAKDNASGVRITNFELASASRVLPTVMPIDLGRIAAGHAAIVEAKFTSIGMTPGQPYLLTVTGTFSLGARNSSFSRTQEIFLPVRAPGVASLRFVPLRSDSTRGARYPHRDIAIPREVNERRPPVPTGPQRGTLRPTRAATRIDTRFASQGQRARPVSYQANDMVFVRNTPLAGGGGMPNDPSTASGGLNGPEVVLVTGNTYAEFSTNGGQTFTRLDPTTIFPDRDTNGNLLDGGLCCDQVLHYDALANRFFWLMQFATGAGGSNRLRLAVASPEALVASAGTAWGYWDITSADVGRTGSMFDYPDLSIGDHFLYASANSGSGLMVFRIALAELIAGGTINIGYTDPANGVPANGKHLIQSPADELFWFGELDRSSLRVYSLQEGSNQYKWRDIDIDSYPFGDFVSNSPDGTNWLASVFSGGAGGVRVRSATSDEVWFQWMAGRGGGFPHPHIQYLRLNRSDLRVIEQGQIWNDALAFNYAAFAVAWGKVGAVIGYGGPTDFGSPAVGIIGDGTFYAPCTSTRNFARYGDYLTVRQAWPTMYLFSAAVYCVGAGGYDSRYLLFGRSADVKPVIIGP